jgi:thioredoxin reductase
MTRIEKNRKAGMQMYDVIIVGAGPAGLSAALLLGRCRRHVLVCDAGHPRNAVSHAMHGFLTRDGIPPAIFLQHGREQLRTYPNVELRDLAVVDAEREADHFTVTLADSRSQTSRKLLFTTGMVDELPEIDGMADFYGQSVFPCPYCDGWEVRDQPLAVYGKDEAGKRLALVLTQWSRDLVFCTDGPSALSQQDLAQVAHLGIVIREERIARLEGRDGQLERIIFANGEWVPRRALFLHPRQRQQCDLPAKLGYVFPPERVGLRMEGYEQAAVSGMYVAGDAFRSQWVINAASEGTEAAFYINTALLMEDLGLTPTSQEPTDEETADEYDQS